MKIRLSILTSLILTTTACSLDPPEQNATIQSGDIQADHKQNNSMKGDNIIIMGGTYHSLNTDDNYLNIICINYDKAIKEVTLVGFDENDMNYTPKFLTLPVIQDRQLLEKCNAEASLTESYYMAYLPEDANFSGYGQVFDANDANGIVKNGQIMGLDFDKDGQQDYLTICSSMEGEHFNAWHDDKKSKKLAYAYRYIDAHLIATCEEIDYEDDYF